MINTNVYNVLQEHILQLQIFKVVNNQVIKYAKNVQVQIIKLIFIKHYVYVKMDIMELINKIA